MKRYKLIALILFGFTMNVFAAKPPPKPAQDLDCVGCVDTVDIAPQAVTTDKLSQDVQDTLQNADLTDERITTNSADIQTNADNIEVNSANISINASNINTNTTDFQQQINQLQDQISQLQALPHDRIEVYDGENNLLGISITLPDSIVSPNDHIFSVVGTLYNQSAKVFVPLEYRAILNSVPVDAFFPHFVEIFFESIDCTGQGYIGSLTTISATKDVLVTNDEADPKLYKTLDHSFLEQRDYISQSFYHSTNGNCIGSGQDAGTRIHVLLSPVAEVQNPLPYLLPVYGPLRLEYVGE